MASASAISPSSIPAPSAGNDRAALFDACGFANQRVRHPRAQISQNRINYLAMTSGLHLLHKPVGPTSFSLVQSCIQTARSTQPAGHRRVKLCHGGALDPFAHGLLLILAGPATRLFDHLPAIPKVHKATVRWAIETDNGDQLC